MKIRYKYWTTFHESPNPGQLCLDPRSEYVIQSTNPLKVKWRTLRSLIMNDLKSVGIKAIQCELIEVELKSGQIITVGA